MAQEIKIGVGADTAAATGAVAQVDRAVDGVALGVEKVGQKARQTTRDLEGMEAAARRLAATQAMLSREMGRPISRNDAETFSRNFDRMKAGRGLGSQRLKAFDGPEEWYLGHGTSFSKASAAAHHRRFVLAAGMQGTEDSQAFGAPADEGEMPDHRAHRPGAGGAGRGMQRAKSMALGFVKGGLALAGINSIMGMASSGISQGGDEAIGIDALKRRMGDLGISFDGLRTQARAAGDGLGVTFIESQRLAQQYAREAGNLTGSSGLGGVRAGAGLSRAYGLDPEQGVQFMGTMRRLGVAGDDQASRRLALQIADGVAKGGYGGKADEVLSAVSNFAAQVARSSLSTPNVGAYLGALTSLTSTGRPGLDPAGAAGILGSADDAIRGGGGMGEAGMNFVYAALRGATSDPLKSKALWSGGLFGTTRGIFGEGSIAGDWYKGMGDSVPEVNDTTNFQRIRDLINSKIAPRYRAEVAQNLFQQSTPQGAMALLGMSDDTWNESQRLVTRAGIKPTASSVGGIAQVARAGSKDELRSIFEGVMKRSDVTGVERGRLNAALDSGSIDNLKTALVSVIGTKEQEETEGSKTRASISDMSNSLTDIGSKALVATNAIRDAVVNLANVLVPGFREGQERAAQAPKDARIDYGARFRARSGGASALLDERIASDRVEYDRLKKAAKGGAVNLDSIVRIPKPGLLKNPLTAGDYELDMARRQALEKIETPRTAGRRASDDARWARLRATAPAGVQAQMAETDRRLGLPPGTTSRQFAKEAGGPGVVSPAGARGYAQVMPKTLAALEKRFGRKLNPDSWDDSILIQREVMRENMARFKNPADAVRAYNSGWDRSKWNNPETNGYVAAIMGSTALPAGAPTASGSAGVDVNIGAPSEITIRDADTGAARGKVVLSPYVTPKPTGAAMAGSH